MSARARVRHGSIDSMSKEDVMKALEEIKQTYAPVTIDITPEGEKPQNRRKSARPDFGTRCGRL